MFFIILYCSCWYYYHQYYYIITAIITISIISIITISTIITISKTHKQHYEEVFGIRKWTVVNSYTCRQKTKSFQKCGINWFSIAYECMNHRNVWIIYPNHTDTFCKWDGKLKTDGLTPSLSRTVCPVLSKSPVLKCSLQSKDLWDATKPSRFTASSHSLLKPLSLGNLKRRKAVRDKRISCNNSIILDHG